MDFLLPNLLYSGIPILLAVAVAATVFALARRRRAACGDGPDSSGTRRAARVAAIVAFVYGLSASLAAVVGVVVTGSMAAQGGNGALTLPLDGSPTTLVPESVLPPFDVGGELVGYAYFSGVTLTGTGLSPGVVIMFYAPMFLTPLLHAIIAFGISSLATRIERQEGFAPQLTRTAVIVGASLIVIGSLSQFLHGYGTGLARFELLGGTPLEGWVSPGPVDMTHLAAGIGLLLLGVLLRHGAQLQRDTKGLV